MNKTHTIIAGQSPSESLLIFYQILSTPILHFYARLTKSFFVQIHKYHRTQRVGSLHSTNRKNFFTVTAHTHDYMLYETKHDTNEQVR